MNTFDNMIDATKRGNLETIRSILDVDGQLIDQRDQSGATPLHYAAFNGHRQVVRLLVERGADINSIDTQAGATPAGWAIEYIRELGGYLATDLDDLAYAIREQDSRWVKRFLQRFPNLRRVKDTQGKSFSQLAKESNNQEIIGLFESDAI